VDATPRPGGKLTIVLAADPPGLDPAQLQGVQNWAEAIAVASIFDQLLYPASANAVRAKIATSLVSDDGGASWTLSLRPGVCFSDGAAFDAEAVRFNWARLADPVNRAAAAEPAAMIGQMQVLDALTLRIKLTAPAPDWNRQVARSLSSIGSPDAISAAGAQFSSAPVGAGPFLLAEWERGRRMRLVRNPHYWQAGKPYLDEVVVLTGIPDAAAKFDAMSSGRAQVALEPVGAQLARYRAEPDRYELMTTPDPGGGVALVMNLERPPFNDARVRRVLALTLDSATFVELAGFADPGMVMTTIDRTGAPYHDPEIRLPRADPQQAQALLDAVRADTGGPVRFTVETFANEGHVREANAVKTILESRLRGLEVEVAVGSVAELAGRWRSGEYQASNYAVRWSDPALDLAASFRAGSPQNVMRYRNSAVDAALGRLAGATEARVKVEAHQAVLRQVLQDVPLVWLAHKEAFHAVDRRAVRDWNLFYSLRPLIEDAWLAAP
jgi:peptide/nickel transport system substrate-binding protein